MIGLAVAMGMTAWTTFGAASTLATAPPRLSEVNRSASRPVVYAWFPARFGSWQTDGIDWGSLTHLCFRSVELAADGKIRRVSGNPPRDFVETANSVPSPKRLNLRQALDNAPVLATGSLGEPAQGVNDWELWLSWDVLHSEFCCSRTRAKRVAKRREDVSASHGLAAARTRKKMLEVRA